MADDFNPALMQMLMNQMGNNQGGASNGAGGMNPAMLQAMMGNNGGGMNPAMMSMLMNQMNQGQQQQTQPPFTTAQLRALQDMMDSMSKKSHDELLQLVQTQLDQQKQSDTFDPEAVRAQLEQLAPMMSEAGRRKLREIMTTMGL